MSKCLQPWEVLLEEYEHLYGAAPAEGIRHAAAAGLGRAGWLAYGTGPI